MRKFSKSFLLVSLVFCLLFSFGFAKTKKSHKVAWMGVYTQTLDDDLVKAFELPVDYGAIINKVVDDSPADEAGLVEDDIIISFGDKKVRTSEDLVDFVREQSPGDKVKLVIIDEDGNKKDMEIELGRKKSSMREFTWTSNDDDDADNDKLRYFYFSDGSYPYIGVSLTELSDQLGEHFGVKDGEGVLISEVEEDSPAAKAGLKAGDVIIAVDDEEVEDAGDIQEIIREKEVGETAEIAVLRDKKKELVKVEVGETEGGARFGNTWNLHIPDLPAIDVYTPKMKGLYQSLDKLDREDFESESGEFQKEMMELKKELKKMKKELKEVQEKLD